jgi:enamine deaminase RidA (YjgF/YER057c/UK114 family)
MVDKQVLTSKLHSVPAESFVQGVAVACQGTLVFVSGVTARQSDGAIAPVGDPAGQTRRVLDNLEGVLREAGATLDDVVHSVTYLTDITHVDAVQRVKQEYFSTPPASTTVQVSRLVDPLQLVEIEAIAVIH